MKFDWPTFSLVMGSTWTLPGALPCFCLMTVNELGPFNKSYFLPQIYGVWQATKQFSVSFGAIAPYDPIKGVSGTPAPGISPDDFSRSQWPTFFTEFVYKTDACGKIGPWMLQFGVGGILWTGRTDHSRFQWLFYGQVCGRSTGHRRLHGDIRHQEGLMTTTWICGWQPSRRISPSSRKRPPAKWQARSVWR